MSKLYPFFSGAACLVWIAGWSCWFFGGKHKDKAAKDKNSTVFVISYDGFKYASEDIFSFSHSESLPFIPEDNLVIFQSLAKYLAAHENVLLTLTGISAQEEQNRTSYPTLGKARAEALKAVLLEKGAPQESILTKSLTTHISFRSNGKLSGGVFFSFSEQKNKQEPLAETATDNQNNRIDFSARTLHFASGKYGLAKEDLTLLDSLLAYLRTDFDKKLVITGFSEPNEEKKASIKLAETRAKAVRRYLVDRGLPRNQIVVSAKPGMARNGNERVVNLRVE